MTNCTTHFKGMVAGLALAVSLGACSTNLTSQREVLIDGDLARKLGNFPAYGLGVNSAAFDYGLVPFSGGVQAGIDLNTLIGRPAIIHSVDDKGDVGATVLIRDIGLEEDYRVTCSVGYDEAKRVAVSWGPCFESITAPGDGDDGGYGDGDGGDGGDGGGGPSGGGGR